MTKIQICNRALTTYLGSDRISSLDEDSPAAEQCSIHYDDTIQGLLELHSWYFASDRETLALISDNDRSGQWLYRYGRPTSALFVNWVNQPETARMLIELGENPDTDREMTDTSIYSNTQFASCDFTKNITDTSIMPQYFKDAASATLAAMIAMPITQSAKIAQRAEGKAYDRFDVAQARDEQERYVSSARQVPEHLKMRGIS